MSAVFTIPSPGRCGAAVETRYHAGPCCKASSRRFRDLEVANAGLDLVELSLFEVELVERHRRGPVGGLRDLGDVKRSGFTGVQAVVIAVGICGIEMTR